MPREFGISSYMTQLVGRGHEAPPWETWMSAMHYNPIPVLRLTQNIEDYEKEHNKPAPPGLVIAWARVQGLKPNPEQVQAPLDARKEWRGHKGIIEPGEGYLLTMSVVPPPGGTVFPEGGNFKAGRTIELVALPSEGYEFDRWTGDHTGTANPATITMDSEKSITARFRRL